MAEPETTEPKADEPEQATAATADTAKEAPAMDVTVEDVGVCKKKLSITIPREAIEKKFDERFTELEREAVVPGFRPGHAPRRLVEKRFRRAVAEEVRVALVSETLTKALEQEKLDVIGEPDLDPESVTLPDDGPLVFSLELEVRPEFTLPDYASIPVDVKHREAGEKDVEAALERLREMHGTLKPLRKGSKAKKGDAVTADVTLRVGGMSILDGKEGRLPVAAVAIEGVPVPNLEELLEGAKVGETKTGTFKVGDDATREDLRGKEAEISLVVKDISRPAPADDKTLLAQTAYETLEALREGLARQLENQAETAHREAQEEAVRDWLLEKVPFELPEGLAQRHAERLYARHLVNLRYRGVPAEEIEKQREVLRSSATENATRDLKLFFILDSIAKKEKIEATDAEVDARVRFIAAQYGRRDDHVREEMRERGTLDSLRSQICEDKVMRLLLEKAKIAGKESSSPKPPKAEKKSAGEEPETT
ncbi:MAG: trigger factor [Phycisphaerae bacterium]|nr:trigger factor [Phycisphaerae bacterium]